MLPALTALLAQTAPNQANALARGIFVAAIVTGVCVGGFVIVAGIAAVRRRRQIEFLKADTRRRRSQDPWTESSNRIETPSADDLERDMNPRRKREDRQ
jgi:hypothetical protein